jgi:uncharacterized protein YchJ
MKSNAFSADPDPATAVQPQNGQMQQILERLGSGEGLPVDAIRAADANRAAMVPLFLRAFEHSAAPSASVQRALFVAFHLLGQWREKSAYRPLAAFLRQPDEKIRPILAEAKTETCHQVMAGVFDGDPNPLYEVILDPDADEYVRSRMCEALAIVTLGGELPREEAARFLHSCYERLQPQDECFVWDGWQAAIARLGLSELKPLVEQAFERGFIDSSWLGYDEFEEDLQHAVDGEPELSWQSEDYEPFGDTIKELSGWSVFAPKRKQERKLEGQWRPQPTVPALNPFKSVGRNDPCPCGSGKKFKKCCLDTVRLAASEPVPQEIDQNLEWLSDDDFDTDEMAEAIFDYDPFIEPEPETWLMTDEQQRLDLVLEYHLQEEEGGANKKVHAIVHVVVENQIADSTLSVRGTLQRLMSEGLDRHQAIHAIGSVLMGYIYDLLRTADKDSQSHGLGPDGEANKAYFAELEDLTAERWLRSA